MKHRIVLAFLFLVLLLPTALQAQENNLTMPSVHPDEDAAAIARVRARMDSIRQHRPTVAVVLGGGGARGMAHLGVLKYMEELGIPIDLIGGTSMGGLVSGLYALGYSESTLDSLVKAIDWTVMMSDKVPDSYQSFRVRRLKERFGLNVPFHYEKEDVRAKIQREILINKKLEHIEARSSEMASEAMSKIGFGLPDGFLFGFNVRNQLSSVSVGYQDSLQFDRLPIPYYCVATDMYSMCEKNWTGGSLVDAMRSTMAIPFYFRPIRKDGMVLSDGGTRNNFPADIAKAMGADIIIGSEMPVHRSLSDLETLPSLAMQNITMMSSDAARTNRKYTDILIQHELPGYNMLSFDDESVDNIIRAGYENALARKEDFEAIAARTGKHPTGEKAHKATDLGQHKIKVGRIDFTGINDKEKTLLYDPAYVPADSLFDRSSIEHIMSEIYGSRAFESVTYHVSGSEAPYVLTFDCQKGQTNEFHAGLHFDSDEMVYMGLRLGIGTRKLSGLRLVTEMKIGNNGSLLIDLSRKPITRTPVFGIALSNRYNDVQFINEDQVQSHIQNINSRAEVYIEDARYVRGTIRAGYAFEMEPFENYLAFEDVWRGWDWKSRFHSAFIRTHFDTFNDGYFPTRGIRASLNARIVFRGYSIYIYEPGTTGDEHTEGFLRPYGTGMASLSWAVSPTERFTIQPTLYAGICSADPGHINGAHALVAGGIQAGRYLDAQMPFFGFSHGYHILQSYGAVGELDLRYRLDRMSYLTLKGGILQDADRFGGLFQKAPTAYAAGLELGWKTIGGPLRIGVHWCNQGGFGLTASYGFFF